MGRRPVRAQPQIPQVLKLPCELLGRRTKQRRSGGGVAIQTRCARLGDPCGHGDVRLTGHLRHELR